MSHAVGRSRIQRVEGYEKPLKCGVTNARLTVSVRRRLSSPLCPHDRRRGAKRSERSEDGTPEARDPHAAGEGGAAGWGRRLGRGTHSLPALLERRAESSTEAALGQRGEGREGGRRQTGLDASRQWCTMTRSLCLLFVGMACNLSLGLRYTGSVPPAVVCTSCGRGSPSGRGWVVQAGTGGKAVFGESPIWW